MNIVIKKGKHHASGLRLRPYLGKRIISWRVNMDISCLYSAINDDSGDLNKLCGISCGNHHNNSLRFAWRPDFNQPGQIMIFAYWYVKGERWSLYIGNICHNVDYYFELTIGTPTVAFSFARVEKSGNITDRRVSFVKYKLPQPAIGYYLWPYFGGNNTTPHDMRIDLNVR